MLEERRQELIAKVEKCLKLASDQEGTPEGDVAKRQAALLMTKYRIEESELDFGEHNFVYDVFEFHWDGAVPSVWDNRLVQVFANLFDCRMVYRDLKYRGISEYEIFGSSSDVETVMYFCEVCSHWINTKIWEKHPQDKYKQKRRAMGNIAVDVLWERTWELKQQMEENLQENEACRDLVVKKTDQIDKEINEMYSKLRKKSMKVDRDCDLDTAQAGIEAGKSCPLNFAIEEEAV